MSVLRTWVGPATAWVCTAAAVDAPLRFFPATDWRDVGQVGPIPFSFVAGLAVLLHFCARSRWAAVGTAIAGTAALALKPLLNPLLTEDGPFGLRSQTHLNYFVPALAMVLLAVLVATASMPQPSKDGSMTARGKMLVLGALACGFCVLFFAGSNYEETFVWLTRGVPALLLGVLTILIATRGGPREPAPALAPAAASPWPSPSGGEWNGSWVDSFASGEAVLPRAQSADFDALVAAIAEAPGTAAEDLVANSLKRYINRDMGWHPEPQVLLRSPGPSPRKRR
ncbi:MAG: hypothetical protein AAF645_25610, partial [Myxococcota bacterium]